MMAEKTPVQRITYNSGNYERFENDDDEDVENPHPSVSQNSTKISSELNKDGWLLDPVRRVDVITQWPTNHAKRSSKT